MARILIVFGILFGLGFWITSKNDDKPSDKSEKTEKETVVEEAAEGEVKKEETVTKKDDQKVEEPSETTEKEKSVQTKTEKVESVAAVVTKKEPVVKKEVAITNTSEVKVFLYEWGIDISEKEIPTGKIVFDVVNNGKFTHEFVIGGVKNYGKVLPGEKKQFSVVLRSGNFEIHSKRRDDYERDMKESFKVVR